MGKNHHKPTSGVGKRERQLKVRESYHEYQLKHPPQQRTPIAQIQLKGHWLVKAGFPPDQPVKVRIQKGKLIITKTP